jgi:hypothetical protein
VGHRQRHHGSTEAAEAAHELEGGSAEAAEAGHELEAAGAAGEGFRCC